MSPDHNALVGRAADPEGFFYATGFSGHGFQQAPAVGEHVAELVAGARADARPVRVRRRRVSSAASVQARGVRRLICSAASSACVPRIRDGRLAGEALADVERRLAVDPRLAREQRHVLARAERDHRVRLERRERRAGDLVLRRADDRELPRRREVEVERAQRPAERRRDPPERSCAAAAGRRPRDARARRRRRSARAAAARTRASSSPTGRGCRRGPSCARRAARRRGRS